jgi:hypothetical protein
MRGLRGAQSRMTVLRREATRSYVANPGSGASLSQSCDACPLDRACLHPSTATSKLVGLEKTTERVATSFSRLPWNGGRPR